MVDWDHHPACKQATNERIAERDKNCIQALILLQEVIKNIAMGIISCEDLPIVNATIAKLEIKR
jgi:hypothetical protein